MTQELRPTVDTEWDHTTATVTMNYEPHNLLGAKLLTPLVKALETARLQGARAIILRSGLRHFSAGADLDTFTTLVSPPPSSRTKDEGDPSQAPGDAITTGTTDTINRLSEFPVPIIASVQGACLGGGLELALLCDYIIAGRSAKFGCVEATLGLHPLMGAIQRISQRAGDARAKEMAMLARRYDAVTMERWNIINLVVDDDELATTTTAVAKELAAGPTVAHTATKQLARIAVNDGVAAADEAMNRIQAPIWSSADLETGLTSFFTSGPGLAQFEGR